jgi:hypothetical protein
MATSTTKAPTSLAVVELARRNGELAERCAALEGAMVTVYSAIASLEFYHRGFKPIPLSKPQNAGLGAIVTSAPRIHPESQPFVLPDTLTHNLSLREHRPADRIGVN